MEDVYFYIDETKFIKNSINYLGLSLVLVRNNKNIEFIKNELESLYNEVAADQYLGLNRDNRIFHFTEDNMEIKPRLVDKIRDFNIKAYIAYDTIKYSSMFKSVYLRILHKLLYDRVSKNKHCNIHVFYEEQSEIKKYDVELIFKDILKTTTVGCYSISETTKKNILICLPDYILGVFRDKTDANKKQYDYRQRNYEKFSSKIRLVIDMEKDIFYSKDNPYVQYCAQIVPKNNQK